MPLLHKELITARFARGVLRGGDGAPSSPSKPLDVAREDLDEESQSLGKHDVLCSGDGEGKIHKEAKENGMDILVRQ